MLYARSMMSRVYEALERLEEEKKRKAEGKSAEERKSFEGSDEKSLRSEETLLKIQKQEIETLGLPTREELPISIVRPGSYEAEEFRKLKTQIFHRFPNPPHSILITSSVPQEGKTMVSVNLAIAISREINKKVILIDGDLRNPGIHITKSKNAKGLSNYLSDGIPVSDILVPSEIENLKIIEAGPSTSRSSELIGSKRMGELLKSVADSGEDPYIIIDSPPIISTAEPMLLSRMVDGVILVMKVEQTPKETISRALKDIDRQKIIGVVLNQMNFKTSPYYFKYYHTYYRKY